MAATVNRLAKPYRPGDLEAPVGSILPEDSRVDTKNTVHERPLVAMSSAPLMSIIRSTDYAQAGMDLYWSFLYLHLKKKIIPVSVLRKGCQCGAHKEISPMHLSPGEAKAATPRSDLGRHVWSVAD